jgi:hypothetical protein
VAGEPPGDSCDQARAEMLANLKSLEGAIQDSDKLLSVAETSGMEVSQARLG